MGITGKVFQTGEIIYSNDLKSLGNFIPSIDNLTNNVKDVRSLLIIPVFGHREKYDKKPIAIL